jgi:RluA family pseudouridine synthase
VRAQGLVVLHEDADVLAVDKPSGLLTIATDAERTRTAYAILTDYVRRGSSRSRERVFIVHRLDRETSGVVLFARTPRAKERLQTGWGETEKHYLAVVHGRPDSPRGVMESRLVEARSYRVYATRNARRGKPARTEYRVLGAAGKLALLDVHPTTGRKHQIRVHLADLGHPVVGDRRYGVAGDEHRRLALHAVSLAFTHPGSGERVTVRAPVPPYFGTLVGRIEG